MATTGGDGDDPVRFGDEARMPASRDGRFTKELILTALERLNGELAARNRKAVLGLCGGAVMTLVHEARISTEDIDAWMDDAAVIEEAAGAVRAALDLPRGWLSDAVQGFLPPYSHKFSPYREWSHLTVMVAQPQVMLVMKLHAARLKDLPDIRFLLTLLRLDAARAWELYGIYYARPIDLEKKLLIDGWLARH